MADENTGENNVAQKSNELEETNMASGAQPKKSFLQRIKDWLGFTSEEGNENEK